MDVVFFIEHVARELDIACSIKALLEVKHAVKVEIVPYPSAEQFLQSVNCSPEVVVLPFAITAKNELVGQVLSNWPNSRYINLSMEQLLGNTQKDYKAPKDEFARNYVLHSAWGEFFADYLIDCGVVEENVVINGNPTLSLYQVPYKKFYLSSKEKMGKRFSLDPDKRWLFIPENYGWAFFSDRFLMDRVRRGFSKEDAFAYRKFANQSLQVASGWWNQAALRDDVEVIIRPRPAIPRKEFLEKVRSFVDVINPHLHFIKANTVREWILASDVVMSSYSTTLVEAAVAEKPVFMLEPYPIPEFLFSEWYDYCESVKNYQEFETALLSDTSLQANWKPLKDWAFQSMINRGDAITNLVELIHDVLLGKKSIASPAPIVAEPKGIDLQGILAQMRNLGWRVYLAMMNFLSLQVQEQTWSAHESDHVNQEVILSKTNAWKKILFNDDVEYD